MKVTQNSNLKPKINPKEEKYLKYYHKLIEELLWADLHLKLWGRLIDYTGQLHVANTFFTVTMKAHLDAALVHLFKIFDTHEDSLSIWKFMKYVDTNTEIFSTESFVRRMAGNTNLDYLLKSHAPVTSTDIEKDKNKLHSKESIIKTLKKRRDKEYSHIDEAILLKIDNAPRQSHLSISEVQDSITAVFEILSRYSTAYDQSTFSRKWLGENDIEEVMAAIQFRLEEQSKQWNISQTRQN